VYLHSQYSALPASVQALPECLHPSKNRWVDRGGVVTGNVVVLGCVARRVVLELADTCARGVASAAGVGDRQGRRLVLLLAVLLVVVPLLLVPTSQREECSDRACE
jgi:hypothetical protein